MSKGTFSQLLNSLSRWIGRHPLHPTATSAAQPPYAPPWSRPTASILPTPRGSCPSRPRLAPPPWRPARGPRPSLAGCGSCTISFRGMSPEDARVGGGSVPRHAPSSVWCRASLTASRGRVVPGLPRPYGSGVRACMTRAVTHSSASSARTVHRIRGQRRMGGLLALGGGQPPPAPGGFCVRVPSRVLRGRRIRHALQHRQGHPGRASADPPFFAGPFVPRIQGPPTALRPQRLPAGGACWRPPLDGRCWTFPGPQS